MATVQRFESGMLDAYVQAKGLKYTVNQDGDYRLDFAFEKLCNCELTVWLLANGPDKSIYTVRVTASQRFAQDEWGNCVLLCNQWNKERFWPRAFLYYDSPEAEVAQIVLDGHLHLEAGIHQELLNDFTDTLIVTARQFWEWAFELRATG